MAMVFSRCQLQMKSLFKTSPNLFLFCIISVIALTGCTLPSCAPKNNNITNQTVQALIVGVADGKVAGPCPGSDVDANTFEAICKEKRIPVVKLVNNKATHNEVKQQLLNICRNSDLAIFYYSGHGGRARENFNPYQNEEADGVDDFLCLYDKAMLDDTIWEIISKAKGRVVCIFDCCHSETMYRAPMFIDKIEFGAPMYKNFADAVNKGGIFVIAGSPEADYSYGSAQGGQLTNAIRKHYKRGPVSYLTLFDRLENDKSLRAYQQPMCTVINGFDGNVEFLQ